MHRTQILLDPEQHNALAEIARREKRSMSDVVREMLGKQLEERKTELTAFNTLDSEDFHAQG